MVAIRKVNDSACGLAGNVWSQNEQKAFGIALRLETGPVTNDSSVTTYGLPEAPFGGIKNSGGGWMNGVEGLLGYCLLKPIISGRFGNKAPMGVYPYST